MIAGDSRTEDKTSSQGYLNPYRNTANCVRPLLSDMMNLTITDIFGRDDPAPTGVLVVVFFVVHLFFVIHVAAQDYTFVKGFEKS